MTVKSLNTIGLSLGILGVVIIFFFCPPQPSFQEATVLSVSAGTTFVDGTTEAERREKTRQEKQLYSCMSKVGLGLIGLGFAFQLCAVWRPMINEEEAPREEAEPGAKRKATAAIPAAIKREARIRQPTGPASRVSAPI